MLCKRLTGSSMMNLNTEKNNEKMSLKGKFESLIIKIIENQWTNK